MGYIGYYLKKDKWWGLLILTPILLFLGIHYNGFLGEVLYYFPYHLLSCLFCIITILIYPIYIFKNKKIKIVGIIISILIIIAATIMTLSNKTTYNTTVLISGGEQEIIFDDTYKVYLENTKLGNVHIEYDEALEDYRVDAEFKKGGKTNLILEDSNGNKIVFELDVKIASYEINKRNKPDINPF